MKLVRFRDEQGRASWGALQADGRITALEGSPFEKIELTQTVVKGAALLAPVVPTAIIGIAANYHKHAAESGMDAPTHPVLFMKLPGAVQDPGGAIILPRHLRSDKVDFEGELAVVIGRRCRNVPEREALDYVLGYTCANDVSARDWQKEWGGGQFCRGKMFDTFCPLGPCLVTPEEIPDPQQLTIRTYVNQELMQEGRTGDMTFSVAKLIRFLSGSTTLWPGTVILTGTPHGVGMARTPPVFLKDGDQVSVEIDRIGVLTNSVVEEGV